MFVVNTSRNSLFFRSKNAAFFTKIFKKLKLSQEKELIIHPELFKKEIRESTSNFNKNIKEKEEFTFFNFQKDPLNFISVDKNGVPKIPKNYYYALGVSPTANSKEIRRNYLLIAKKYHPDIHPESLVS
jgi:hypothetical protein